MRRGDHNWVVPKGSVMPGLTLANGEDASFLDVQFKFVAIVFSFKPRRIVTSSKANDFETQTMGALNDFTDQFAAVVISRIV
jgi:hypothetical protein